MSINAVPLNVNGTMIVIMDGLSISVSFQVLET